MRRPEVTSGQQSRVKKETEDITILQDWARVRKKVETSNRHKGSVGKDLEVIQRGECTKWEIGSRWAIGVDGRKKYHMVTPFLFSIVIPSWSAGTSGNQVKWLLKVFSFAHSLIEKKTNNTKQKNSQIHTLTKNFTVLETAAAFGRMKARQTDYIKTPTPFFTIPMERCCVVMD